MTVQGRGESGVAWHELVRRRLSDERIAPTTIDSLLRGATPRIFGPRQVIASTDAPLAGLLIDGYAAALTSDDAGHELVLTIMRRGQAFAAPFRGESIVPTIELVGLTRVSPSRSRTGVSGVRPRPIMRSRCACWTGGDRSSEG